MALIKCKHCGGLLSSLAEKCPHCGEPVGKEPQKQVENPHVPAFDKPQPVPEPAVNDAPEYDEEESHTGRNVTLLVLFLILVAAGIFFYNQQSGSNDYKSVMEDMDTTAVDTTVADSAMMDYTMAEDTCVAEPEEALDVPSQRNGGSRQLLATYRYGGLRRDYYWETEVGKLSIYDENGTCLKKHNLGDAPYGVFNIDGVVKLYNHHVYFAGEGGGGSAGIYYVIFYLTPQEGNGIHVIEDFAEGEYEFQESSVRIRRLKLLNGHTAQCAADYEYEETWETIQLQ